jgi:hypothetical protein
MAPRRKASLARMLLITITMLVAVLASACRNHRRPGAEAASELDGVPEQYSATIVHTIDDGTTRETRMTREARSGEKCRQEWTEGDQSRALIWRPDLGKSFLLDLDRRAYVEMEIGAPRPGELDAGAGNAVNSATARNSNRPNIEDLAVQTIDHYFDDTPLPARTEIQTLPPVVIEGYQCRVYEQRASFLDGHTEITRRFRAVDLAGLILRIEGESEGGSAKITTERRDVRIEVAPDAFVVPVDFKRIERLR